jgi:uncharacterized protein
MSGLKSTTRGAAAIVLALLLYGALAAPAAALDFPALTGRVVDQAGILDAATRTALTGKLEKLEGQTTDQLVVVTLKSLQGRTIEDFGVELGRTWQIGQKGKNNGMLLIVAPNERKVRIEVGYGLEATLTDAIARVIIDTSIIPRFRANDFPGGIVRGADDIIQVLNGDAESFRPRVAPVDDTPNLFPIIFILGMLGLAGFVVFRSWTGRAATARKSSSGASSWDRSSRSSSGSSSSSGDFSGSSSSSGDFSGGGGSFGGGGSSDSW